MAIIYPSLIAANQLNLEKIITELDPYCHGYHLDIMDNHFCPNITLGIDTINAIARLTNRQLWVHLMVTDPGSIINRMILSAESIVTFHFESTSDIKFLVKTIKEKKWRAGIAIKPKTDVKLIFPFLDIMDQILIMSVEPGFSGQLFLQETVKKIEPLLGYRQTDGLPYRIAIDGGVNEHNITQLAHKGVDDFVVGSAIFGKKNNVEALQYIESLIA